MGHVAAALLPSKMANSCHRRPDTRAPARSRSVAPLSLPPPGSAGPWGRPELLNRANCRSCRRTAQLHSPKLKQGARPATADHEMSCTV
jgi:hypothetical protein